MRTTAHHAAADALARRRVQAMGEEAINAVKEGGK
jgi:hypothetical protein